MADYEGSDIDSQLLCDEIALLELYVPFPFIIHSNQGGFRMKNKNVWQAVKFTLFSASAGLIQLISFALLHDVFKIPDYNACYLPSLILSVLWNFTFNRRYTFRSDGNVKRAMLLVALYYVVFITLSRWWSTELVALGVHDWLIEVINMLVNFVTEFLFQKFVVYRGTIDTNELAKKEQA